jgi:hypothetical protein
MNETPPNVAPPSELWLELKQKELDDVTKEAEGVRKDLRKREFALLIVCLLAVIYTHPVRDLSINPAIEIKAIDLSIPLKDAITLFPTIIATMYLVFLSTVVSEGILNWHKKEIMEALHQFEISGTIPKPQKPFFFGWELLISRGIVLPSSLHFGALGFNATGPIIIIVNIFIGIIFVMIPFGSGIFITIRAYKLSASGWLLTWDSICIFLMILAFVNSLIFARISKPGYTL